MVKTKLERLESLNEKIKGFDKTYGKNSLMNMGTTVMPKIDGISTGSLQLDIALGVGGFAKGRVTEIYGGESSGKSTLALHAVSNSLRNGGVAAYIDVEHAFDKTYAESLGIDMGALFMSQPDCAEDAMGLVNDLCKSGDVDIVVLDSVAALTPRVELDGEMSDATIGVVARLMSKALKQICSSAAASKTTVVFINQVREKIGVMFGNPETTTGGRALKFYSSQRIEVRRLSKKVNDGEDQIGNRVKFKVQKNKVAPPFKEGEYDIIYGQGVSLESEVVELGVKHEIIEKAGAWFSYKGSKIGQGAAKTAKMLEDNEELRDEIKEKILSKIKLDKEKEIEEKRESANKVIKKAKTIK